MTTILHKRGQGIPTADKFSGVGEILIDTETGISYTLTDGGDVSAVGGDPEWAVVGKENEEQVGMYYWAQSVHLGYTNKSNHPYTDEAVGIGFNATVGYGGVGIGWDASGGMLGVAVGWKSQSSDDGTAIGAEAKAMYTASIALGKGAETTKAYEFAISSRIKEVNFSGTTVQADDFLDADGKSIVSDVSNPMSTDSLNQCYEEDWGIIGEGFELRTDGITTNRFWTHIFQDQYVVASSADPDSPVFRLTAVGGGSAHFNCAVQATDFLDADGNSIVGSGGDQFWTVSEPDEYGQRLSKFADQVADSDANGLPFYIRYPTDGHSNSGQSSLMQASWVYGDTIWGDRLKATKTVEATEVEAERVTADNVTATVLGSGLSVTAGLVVHGIGIKSDEPAPKLGAGYAIGAGYSDSPVNPDNFNFTVAFDGSVRSSKKIQALDFLDKDGNSIKGSNIPFDEDAGVISAQSIRFSMDGATGEWGPDVYDDNGGALLKGGHGDSHAYARLDTVNFKPYLISQAYQQWAYDTDNESITPPHDPGVWALWECHSAPNRDFNIRIWGGKTAKDQAGVMKRPGMGAPQARCEFYDGHFSEVRSGAYLDKDGGAMMSINDVIEGFSAVQQAVSDEVTVEGLRDAIANSVGGFIERLEARQAEVQGEVKKAADDYHDLVESHYAKTQEGRAK